jgi:SLOG cluster2
MTQRRHRSNAIVNRLIGISTSYERDDILARGLGLGHLREMLLRLARPLVRQSASIAYGGSWEEKPENFTYDLLRLIADEEADNSLGGPDTNRSIGRLINYLAWPFSLEVTPQVEATWINICRIVRVTQAMAGISDSDAVPDAKAKDGSDRSLLQTAITLSAMRRLSTTGMELTPRAAPPERIPRLAARVILGGKLRGYSSFLPGIWEEALVTLEKERPLFVLGGFGGAAGLIADALLSNKPLPEEFEPAWHAQWTPATARLDAMVGPSGPHPTTTLLTALRKHIESARGKVSEALRTGLTEEETRALLTSYEIPTVVHLVLKGLDNLNAKGRL